MLYEVLKMNRVYVIVWIPIRHDSLKFISHLIITNQNNLH